MEDSPFPAIAPGSQPSQMKKEVWPGYFSGYPADVHQVSSTSDLGSPRITMQETRRMQRVQSHEKWMRTAVKLSDEHSPPRGPKEALMQFLSPQPTRDQTSHLNNKMLFENSKFGRAFPVTVIKNYQCGVLLVTCVEFDSDASVHLKDLNNREVHNEKLRTLVKPLPPDQSLVGQMTLLRGKRGLTVCRVDKLRPEPTNRHDDIYSVSVFSKTPDGDDNIIPMGRRVVYELPVFLIQPINADTRTLSFGDRAMFIRKEEPQFFTSFSSLCSNDHMPHLRITNEYTKRKLQRILGEDLQKFHPTFTYEMDVLKQHSERGFLISKQALEKRRALDPFDHSSSIHHIFT